MSRKKHATKHHKIFNNILISHQNTKYNRKKSHRNRQHKTEHNRNKTKVGTVFTCRTHNKKPLKNIYKIKTITEKKTTESICGEKRPCNTTKRMGILPSAKSKWQVTSAPNTNHQVPTKCVRLNLIRRIWDFYAATISVLYKSDEGVFKEEQKFHKRIYFKLP